MSLLDAIAPHDGLSFQELSQSYNFRNISDRRRTLAALVADELNARSDATVLDIGCGNGIGMDPAWQWGIRPHASQYIGVEPDPTVDPDPALFDHIHHSSFENAKIPSSSIDVAYSFLVMEHVENPDAFMKSLFKCLKPGGVYYFVTPNGNHYFTRIAKLLRRLNVSEFTLKLIRRQAEIDDYHYPVQYRFNDVRSIESIVSHAGFCPPKFAFVEKVGAPDYFPGPTKLLFHLLALKRQLIRNPDCLLTMIGRIERPATRVTKE